MIACDETGHPETEYKQKDVGKETYAQKREDERAVGQLIAHYRREHQQRAGDIYHHVG